MKTALFLDRDGVINEEKQDSYIFTPSEFVFYPNVLSAISLATQLFDYLFIVTNQRGIGKGLMTSLDLEEVHNYMLEKINEQGGAIHKIYYSPHLENDHPSRKPNIGMGLQAKRDFPDIDFSQSYMVGNNISDMKFGRKLKMKTAFLHTTSKKITLPNEWIDGQFASLQEVISAIKNKNF